MEKEMENQKNVMIKVKFNGEYLNRIKWKGKQKIVFIKKEN